VGELADGINKILDGIGKVAWPLIALFVAWKLYPALLRVVESRGFKVKVGEMEIDVQQASDQLTKQVQDLQDKVAALETRTGAAIPSPGVAGAARAVEPAATAGLAILWVDDRPTNNAFEIAKLRDDGARVLLAASTDEALQILSSERNVSAVISDMGRQERGTFNPTAGLDLVRRLRDAQIDVPVYFYSTSRTLERLADDVAAAGAEATSSPVELLRLLKTQEMR
jgi:CheY-like chemotaxis protein